MRPCGRIKKAHHNDPNNLGTMTQQLIQLYIRMLLVVPFLCVAITLQSGCKSGPVTQHPSPISQPPASSAQPAASSSAVVRLICPLLDSTATQPTAQSKGGHRVILSWKASPPADSKHAAAAGYCIYRGTERNVPPTERVNVQPFPDTKCMDDLVENGKKYYYVVRAISARGVISIVSNPAPAAIPTWSRSNADIPGDSTPRCRVPVGTR